MRLSPQSQRKAYQKMLDCQDDGYGTIRCNPHLEPWSPTAMAEYFECSKCSWVEICEVPQLLINELEAA